MRRDVGGTSMIDHRCRACRRQTGEIVLDLGVQPPSDYFPAQRDPGPDPCYPLQMWLCDACGLAQLLEDPTVAEEPRGIEPTAVTRQAVDALERLLRAGWLRAGMHIAEYGSPHGDSWAPLIEEQGMSLADDQRPADVVLDCFGLMHDADQAAAVAERCSRVGAGGVLLVQFHSLAGILRLGQWNALRHGHYAYHSMRAVMFMLAEQGFGVRSAWEFDLFGGSVLLAATRAADGPATPDTSVHEILEVEDKLGVRDPDRLRHLQRETDRQASALRAWLEQRSVKGAAVYGYAAASRAVPLLCRAGLDKKLLAAIADGSPAKTGLRMPGTDIPVIGPADLVEIRPDDVLLLISDLAAEVRAQLPEIEAAGGTWTVVDELFVR